MTRIGMRVMTRPDVRSNRPAIDGRMPRIRLEVADILRRHADAYRRDHAGHLGRVERRVMSAVVACRTEALGGHIEACDDCGMGRIPYNSCRNRHFPKCQGPTRAAWLAAREADLPFGSLFPPRLYASGADHRDRLPRKGPRLRDPV